jgi:hypothetical protein
MTQDEIIEMAREAGGIDIESRGWTTWVGTQSTEFLERFANLVADKKQERIIEVVERLGTWAHITEVVAEIRGEA